MTTKQQERDALAQIIAELGGNSYVGTALNGVLHYAEENIDCDAAFTAPASECPLTRRVGEKSEKRHEINEYKRKKADKEVK